MSKRDEVAAVLEAFTNEGPRDLDVALDAIFATLGLNEVGEPKGFARLGDEFVRVRRKLHRYAEVEHASGLVENVMPGDLEPI